MLTPMITLLSFFLTTAQAGVDPSNKFKLGDGSALTNKAVEFNKGAGSANPSIRMDSSTGKLQFSNDGALFKDIGSGSGSGSGIQLLSLNPDFEGTISNWSASVGGTFTLASAGTNLLFGIGSGVFNASATGQTVTSEAVTIPGGLLSAAGVVSCYVKTSASDYKLQAVQGGTVLAESVISASTVPYKKAVPFVFPASGTVALRLSSQSNAGDLAIDNCFVGSSEGIQLTQATLVASAYYAQTTNCAWATASVSLAAFPSDADCPAPTVETNAGPGTVSAVDADLPQFTFTDLPRGNYVAVFSAPLFASATTTAELAVTDGTTTRSHPVTDLLTSAATVEVSGSFSYTSSGSRTFALHAGNTAANTITLYNNVPTSGTAGLKFRLYRFPDATEQAFTAGTVAQSFSATHADDCAFLDTSLTYVDPAADASCTFSSTAQNITVSPLLSVGDDLPGIELGGLSVGKKYKVCADRTMYAGAASYARARFNVDGVGYLEGSTEHYDANTGTRSGCVVFAPAATTATVKLQVAVSAGSGGIAGGGGTVPAISWHGMALSEQVPAPVFAGSLITPSGGVMNVVSVAFAGNAGETAVCSSSPCTIARQSGGVTSVTRTGTGAYTVNFATGTFSSPPVCTGVGSGIVTATFVTGVASVPHTTTTAQFYTVNPVGPATIDEGAHVICMGAK